MMTSHLAKVMDRCIKNKIEKLKGKKLLTVNYQSSFKPAVSTNKNITIDLN